MLLELAVGDAYGAGFEYVDRDVIQANNDLSRFVKHPRHNIVPGRYTDDMQMSLAIAELLISGQPWTALALADKFVEVFKRDRRVGYSARFFDLLERVETGQQFLAAIDPRSDKSGAAMRAAPIGVLPSIWDVIEQSSLQAAITHGTPDGVNAAVAAALMSHYCLYCLGPKHDIGQFINTHVAGDWAEPWHGKVKTKGWMSVRAAITALIASDSMTALLQRCVAFSGDVDTVAAIALAAGAHSIEIAQDLPENLVLQLENGPFGREYLIALDAALLKTVPEHER
jgi:ADP-ribosylglycohydrolase